MTFENDMVVNDDYAVVLSLCVGWENLQMDLDLVVHVPILLVKQTIMRDKERVINRGR